MSARRPLLAFSLVAALSLVGGCDEDSAPAAELAVEPAVEQGEDARVRTGEPDGRLQTHEIVPSTPTPEGLAYIEAVAKVHRDADAAQGQGRLAALRRGLELEVPGGLPEAEVLRLELASRVAAVLLEQSKAGEARDLLQPLLDPARSVPLDRASAEALVILGDAAARTGDDALAAGTYGRSIRMMSILREELEQ